ncbi:TetR/AcrR family transcriptional regulator [Paraconexibacter antarcticus]|uniref:TetR/AcrR family transcriptional regulator n=1 Tax=Paraconexibacter antarcticus TaxID=2949664 RepID=A0ABY5DNW6_9ACTN|nr:TetR/AcrR family transcriptional regulator [Paraconexibacter antarcticus]UTI63356.1 TetR/AcrR family transcriptional regulator [Paraconexibacter antarcticus]
MNGGLTTALLDGARDAFARHGYARCTLEQIAAAAGVSRVTLHRRGISKRVLLAALAERATTDYQAAMWPVLISNQAPPERLHRAIDVLIEQAERHMAVLVALGAQSDEIFHEPGDHVDTTRSVFTEPLERILDDGRADGSLRAEDPAEVATALFNTVGWSYIHLRTGHRWGPDRAAASVRETVLHGVLRTVRD